MSSPERRGVKRKHGLELGVQISGRALALVRSSASGLLQGTQSAGYLMQTLWLTQVPQRGWMAFLSFPCMAHTLIQRHRHLLIELGAIVAGQSRHLLNATQSSQSLAQGHTAGHYRFSLPCQTFPLTAAGGKCSTEEHLTASVYQAPSWQPRKSAHTGVNTRHQKMTFQQETPVTALTQGAGVS